MMRRIRNLFHLSTLIVGSGAFTANPQIATITPSSSTRLSAVVRNDDDTQSNSRGTNLERALTSAAVSLAILSSPLHNTPLNHAGVAHADEWGKETEAPTLFTGETVMICKKRGPLGACLETTVRTVDNDNDKALKYFKDPSAEVKRRQERALQQSEADSEGNALIQKLRKQSEDNKEKNDMAVRAKTLLNDQSASFGPFDRQVVILNTDGQTFTLLQNPQAMRLKKAGYIEDRKFVIQPSQQVIDEALEGGENLGDAIKGLFGGGGKDKEEVVAVQEEEVSVAEVKAESASEEGSVVDGNAGEVSSE